MKALLNKEFRLCLHPTVFIYLALVLMLLIPSYPYLVSCFFVCNAIFFIFQTSRENGDALYTAMLPVSKAQAVKTRCRLVVLIQMIDLVLMAGMCALSLVAMPGMNNGGTDHSLTLLAFALILFAIFNTIFLPSFYKNGYKAGSAFLKGAIGVWVWIVIAEGLMIAAAPVVGSGVDSAFFRFLFFRLDCFPRTSAAWIAQGILFGCAAVLYAGLTLLAVRRSVRLYERVDVQ